MEPAAQENRNAVKAAMQASKLTLADVDELFRAIYGRTLGYDALEPMARLVFEAALEGDSQAHAILQRGGRYLATMVNAVASKLGMQRDAFEVITAGSVFKGEAPHLIEAMHDDGNPEPVPSGRMCSTGLRAGGRRLDDGLRRGRGAHR